MSFTRLECSWPSLVHRPISVVCTEQIQTTYVKICTKEVSYSVVVECKHQRSHEAEQTSQLHRRAALGRIRTHDTPHVHACSNTFLWTVNLYTWTDLTPRKTLYSIPTAAASNFPSETAGDREWEVQTLLFSSRALFSCVRQCSLTWCHRTPREPGYYNVHVYLDCELWYSLEIGCLFQHAVWTCM